MKRLSVLVVGVCLIQCNNAGNTKTTNQSKLKQSEWLLGTWQMAANDYKIVEHWQKINHTLFTGASYYILNNGDTPERETLKLLLNNDTLYYIPQVNNQNEGKEIPFREKSISANELSFENPLHDFPKLIRYRKLSDTSILAVVSAGQKSIEFNYTRNNRQKNSGI